MNRDRHIKARQMEEGNLFPLEEKRKQRKKQRFCYEDYYRMKRDSSNKKYWMVLFPDPKR